jgi:outer membrane lipoprotein SlyB
MLLLAVVFVAGCASVDGVGRYRVESIGSIRKVRAKIISARPVLISTESSGVGAATGALVGTQLTRNSDNAGVILIGIVGGLIVGEMIETGANTHKGTEYMLQTSNEAILAVAQINQGNPVFKIGDGVTLVYGFPRTLVPDPP